MARDKVGTASYPAVLRPKLIGAREAAERLGVTKKTIYNLMDAGRLEYVRIPSSTDDSDRQSRRIPETAIERILTENFVPRRIA